MYQIEAFADRGAESGTRPGLDAFAAPPRFSDATFESYRPDPRFPSQSAARERVVAGLAVFDRKREPGRRWVAFAKRRPESDWQGLYLDGGFGVGKTHLLAAAWHAAPIVPRAYLSFQELTYVVGAFSMAGALDLLGTANLICLDEFELDDPGNTMLATSFVRGALDRGARIIATSNTLPNDLGQGRFHADEFKREIGQLASAFESISIDGEDYRRRRFAGVGSPPRLLSHDSRPPIELRAFEWAALLHGLAGIHPIHYGRIAANLDSIWLCGAAPILDQDSALRFVHFADKLYDHRVPLAMSGDVSLDTLFPSTYGYGAFERKFRRCRSRLFEMLSEPLPAAVGHSVPTAADD